MDLLRVNIQPGEVFILTPAAIVLVAERHPPASAYAAVVVDEELHALVDSTQLSLKEFAALNRVTVSSVAHLPPEILRHPACRGLISDTPAVIYPRAEFIHLRLSLLRGLMVRRRHGPPREVLLAGIPFWRNRRVRECLGRMGYPVT